MEKKNPYKSPPCSPTYNHILLIPCKVCFHWTCDRNNMSVPPVVCTVPQQRGTTAADLYLCQTACDRGHTLLCHRRQQPANSNLQRWASEAPFTCVQHPANIRGENEEREMQFIDWRLFTPYRNSAHGTLAVMIIKR